MHRIDGPGAAPGGHFSEGDPVTGTPATVVTGAWAEAVQEEIAGVVEASGLALAKPNNAQLAEAIGRIISAALAAHVGAVNPHTAYAPEPTAVNPVLQFGGAAVGIAYAARSGWWLRVGHRVDYWLFLQLSSKGSSSGLATVTIPGMPLAAGNFPGIASVDMMQALPGEVSGMLVASSNVAQLRYFNGSTSQAASISDANFTNDTSLYLSGSYLTA